jgi:hypothetical protein
MQVGNEIKRLVFLLQLNVLADSAKVVTPMGTTRRLNTRQNTHKRSLTYAKKVKNVR